MSMSIYISRWSTPIAIPTMNITSMNMSMPQIFLRARLTVMHISIRSSAITIRISRISIIATGTEPLRFKP